MASRYDQHAQLIEDLYAAGESFTGVARRLQEEFGIPLDASGLRRWLLRRLAKREQRRVLLAPPPAQNPAEMVQKMAVDQVTRGETAKATEKTPETLKQNKPQESMSDLIKNVQAREEDEKNTSMIKRR